MSTGNRKATNHTCTPGELRARLDYADAELLAECEVHTYRASGPGGQKRNKTSSAVRLHHKPSGLIVPATESRSQHENKARALRRLREEIAVAFRAAPPERIVWPENVDVAHGKLHVSDKNPSLHQVMGLVLDVLDAHQGRLAESAAQLGVTSSSLTRFLSGHRKAWAEANRVRRAAGLSALRSP